MNIGVPKEIKNNEFLSRLLLRGFENLLNMVTQFRLNPALVLDQQLPMTITAKLEPQSFRVRTKFGITQNSF